MPHKSRHRRRGRPSRLRLMLTLLGVVAIYLAVLAGIKIVGSRLENQNHVEIYGDLEGRFEPALSTTYNGRTYEYAAGRFTNILLIGVDREELTDVAAGVRDGGQADFMLLLVVDGKNRTITPIQLDRDTYTTVQVYGAFGNPAGEREMQMGLAYAFGDGSAAGCKNTAKAVSDLLGGIPIDYYFALDMDGIAVFNDALGGVTVTLEDDFSAMDPEMTPGKTITLTGEQAEIFVRSRRSMSVGTNQARMQRQRSFMYAAMNIFYAKMEEDLNFFGSFLDTIASHTYMNMERGWLINLAYTMSKYEQQDMVTFVGEHTIGADGFMEFHPDCDALQAKIIEIFYS